MRKPKYPIDSRDVIVSFIATTWLPASMLEHLKARRCRSLMPPEDFPE